jgi:hypothetical protein
MTVRPIYLDCGYEPGVTPLVQTGDCPERDRHTPCPEGYVEWHEWADTMSKTHAQVRCRVCGKCVIWLPKAEARVLNAAWRKEAREMEAAYKRMWKQREAAEAAGGNA